MLATGETGTDAVGRRRRPPAPATIIAVAWVFLAGFLYLIPSLVHGRSLGSLDILNAWGMTAVPGGQVHNAASGDQIGDMIPWAVLSWHQVHHGQFPLWNPYSGLGMPLFGNFQSAALSLPSLISYLAPLPLVFTVQVYVKLVIAGTGVLWMCRRLGLGNLAAATGATAFMLSGSFTGWLGWPMSGTVAWLGWAVGTGLLIVRGENRRVHTAGLAVVVAFIIYAGHPETSLMALASTAVMVVAALIIPLFRRTRDALKALGMLMIASIAGLALSAPLLLPGLQIVSRANRANVVGTAEPVRLAVNVLFATYHGLPIRGSVSFGAGNYYEAASYVGFVVVVLAAAAIVLRWRQAPVVGLVLIGALGFALAYSFRLTHILDRYPFVKNVQWTRMTLVLDFALATLAAFGLQSFLDRWREHRVRLTFVGVSLGATALLGLMWMRHSRSALSPVEASIQARSFIWPALSMSVVLVVVLAMEVGSVATSKLERPRQILRGAAEPSLVGGALIFAASAAFLLTATPRLMSSSSEFFPITRAVTSLRAAVGSSRVGFAACRSILSMSPVGIPVEANGVYGVSEISAYDGTIPKSYFTSYFSYLHEKVPHDTGFGQWCPSVYNARIARHFGVSYVLTTLGEPRPAGTVPVGTIIGQDLFRVPASGVITVETDGSQPDSANAEAPPVTESDPSVISSMVVAAHPSTAYIHVTDFPGWHGSLDGHPLPLRVWGGTMLAASIPVGRHHLSLTYEPAGFVIGWWVALIAALGLTGVTVWPHVRRVGRRTTHPSDVETNPG